MHDATMIIHSEPDKFGRCQYTLLWSNPDRPYCAVCGTDPQIGCAHVSTDEYARCVQVFFAVPPQLGQTTGGLVITKVESSP